MSGLRNSSHRKHVQMDIPIWMYILSPIIVPFLVAYLLINELLERI